MVTTTRRFVGDAAGNSLIHRETNVNAQLTELRARAIDEIFQGNLDIFEQAFVAWPSVNKERFDNDSSRAKTLISMLREWFDEFQRDSTAFIQKITEAIRRLNETTRNSVVTLIHH